MAQTIARMSGEAGVLANLCRFNFIVTGCTGWLGRFTSEALAAALGKDFAERVILVGSEAKMMMVAGRERRVHPMSAVPASRLQAPTVVFHYAFLTKDRVDIIGMERYVASNQDISRLLARVLASRDVKALVMMSSGAVYDYVDASRGRDSSSVIYGKLKKDDEDRFGDLAERKGFSLVVPRLFNLSGPYINKTEKYILGSILMDIVCKRPINVRARRPVFRSYIGVGDLVGLCMRLAVKGARCVEIFDTSGDRVIEVGELATLASTRLSGGVVDVWRPPIDEAPGDYYVGNPERIERLFHGEGLTPLSLEEQIDLTFAFIRTHIGGAATGAGAFAGAFGR